MRLLGWLGLGATAFALPMACSYPDFRFGDGDEKSTSSSSGGGGGTPTSSSSVGGMGGDGGAVPVCALGEIGACGEGRKCSVVEAPTGETGCVDAGSRPAWAKCLGDTDCQEGTFCDLIKAVCRPLCEGGDDCGAAAAQCAPAVAPGVPPFVVPDLKLCTSHCNPMSGAPCSQANGPTTCYYDYGLAEFDCASTLNDPVGSPCNGANACVVGAACIGDPPTCRAWCTPPQLFGCMSGFGDCVPLDPEVNYEGDEYGGCVPG